MENAPVLNYYSRPRPASAGRSAPHYHSRRRKMRYGYPRTDHDIEKLIVLLKLATAGILIASAILAYGASDLLSSKAFRNFIDRPREEPPVRYIVIPVRD